MIARARHGYTLIEMIIANVILAGLIIMVMITIVATSRPTNDATQRSFIVSQGSSQMGSLTQELASGYFDPTRTAAAFCLGDEFDVNNQTFTVNDASFAAASALRDYDTDPVGQLYYGRAIRFLPVTGFSEADYLNPQPTNLGGPLTGTMVTYAFVPDEGADGVDNDSDGVIDETDEVVDGVDNDGDGLVDELKFVRAEGTLVIDLLKDIPRGATGAPGTPPGSPYLELSPPADLRIVYSMRRRVDYDATTNQQVFAEIEFSEKVNLRNVNQ